jgi:hypothetical protein
MNFCGLLMRPGESIADRFSAAASVRLRVTIDRNLSSSALLDGSAMTRLLPSSFAQLIFVAQYE